MMTTIPKGTLLIFLCYLMSSSFGQSTQSCTTAGITSCCQSESCRVSTDAGDCFCDQLCYATRDCCNDIEFICPPSSTGIPHPTTSGPSDDDDLLMGSGSGSGSGLGSGAPPTPTDPTPNEEPPSLVIFEPNRTISVNTVTTSRIFINVTYEPGTPRGLLVWRHEGAIISSRTDSRVSILSNGGLKIRSIRPEDRGLYTVEVSNRVGIESANFTIRLEFVVITESAATVLVNGLLRFNCTALAFPSPRFLPWENSTGGTTPASFTNESVLDDGVIEAVNILEVPRSDCVHDGGYVCVFGSQDSSATVRSNLLECPAVPVMVSLERSIFTFLEGSGTVEVCAVVKFNGNTDPIELTLNASGTATANEDFIMEQMALTLYPKEPAFRVCVNIVIVDDLKVEKTEQFILDLTSDDEDISILIPKAIVLIEDDDLVHLVFDEPTYEVSEAIGEPSSHLALLVCVVQNASHLYVDDPSTVEITISTEERTARGGIHFVAKQTNLMFALSNTSTKLCECIQLLANTVVEGDKVFDVVVTSTNPAVIGSRSTITIKDDDMVTVNLERTEYAATEDSPLVEVCVTVTGDDTRGIVVYVCTEGDTAIDEEDYRGLTAHRLVFPSADTMRRQCISISILDDALAEDTERFFVTLQMDPRMPASMMTGQNSTASVIIRDNDTPSAIYNDSTPFVYGDSITISFITQSRQFSFSSIECILQGPGRTSPIMRNCTSGMLTFFHVPLRYQEFQISIEGVESDGTRFILNQRSVRLDTEVCSVHFVNEGVKTMVNGSTDVVVEWQGSGPDANSKVKHFTCWRDKIRTSFPCSSPLELNGMGYGDHRLIVQPASTTGCRRHVSRAIYFTV